MPKFQVDTDQGTFVLELDKAPRDQAELTSLAEEALSGGAGPQGPNVPEPEGSPGFFSLLGEELAGGAEEFMFGGMASPLGAARIAGAPFTAAGKFAGGKTLEATGSPALATAADMAANLGTGALAGGGARLASKGFRRLVAPRLPGAGSALREAGRETAEALPGKILPAQPSEQLFQRVATVPGTVKVPKFRNAVESLLDDQEQLAKFGRQRKAVVNQLEDTLRTLERTGDEISFQDLVKLRQDIGADVGALVRQGGPELGAQKLLFRSLSDDLDASTGPAANLLKQANRAFRREAASADLGEIIAKGINRPRQGTDVLDISFAQMLKNFRDKTRKDQLFRGSFPADERKAIESTLEELAKLPVSPPAKGQSFGFGRLGKQGATGALLAQATGLPMETGALLGIVGSSAIETLLQTPSGRQALIGIVKNSPQISARTVSLLTAAARATTELEGAIGDARSSTTERAR